MAARLAVAVVCVVVAGLVMAACGGGSPDASPPSTTGHHGTAGDSSSTTAPASTTTTSPTAAAVLRAYRAGWTAYEHALAVANPADPDLAVTMVDPLLQRVKANLLGYQHDGIVGRGAVRLNPKVTSLSSAAATVVDCMFSSSELVYANTGKSVPPVTPPENDGVTSTLVISGGAWKVSQQSVTEGKCPAGS